MTEYREIPKGWEIVRLDEICKTTSGGTPSRQNGSFYNGQIPWVKSGELNYNVIYDTEEHISEIAVRNSSAKVFPKGTLLIALYGATIGKLATLGVDATSNQAVCGIFESIAVETKYLYNFLYHIRRNLIEKGAGGAQPNISQGVVKEISIPLPPLPEQHRIVSKIEELFSSLDKGVESLKTARQQLKVYRQAVLKWAFEGRLTNCSSIVWVKLGELCKNVEYGSATKSKESGTTPVLRMGNIQNGLFDWNDLVYTSDNVEIDKYLLQKGDVLFNRTNSPEWVGKTAIYKGERPAIFAGYLIRINYLKDKLNPSNLNYFLNSQTAKNHGNSVKSFGVNQSNINGTKLKEYPFPICSLTEQQAIVSEIESRLSVCDKIEESITQSLLQAEALRQSILKKAFEGKLVPQDPADEPAGVLLERIKAEREKNGVAPKVKKVKKTRQTEITFETV